MKRKLLLATALVASALGMRAQTDVTSTYVVNAGFENSTARTTNIAASGSPAGDDYESTGWKLAQSSAWSSSAIVAYGGTGQVNGASAPSADNAGNSGNTLGVSVGWNGINRYQSTTAVTLPAGSYTMTVYGYNNLNGQTGFTSLNGFVTTSGTTYLSDKKSFSYGKWEEDKITFTLNDATEGRFQIGGQAGNAGSGNHAKVFFDNITLTCSPFATSADYTELNEAIAAVENKAWGFDVNEYAPYNYVGVLEALAEAKAIDQRANNSQTTVRALTATLNGANWTANTTEVNAIWDPSFEHEYSTSGNVQPIAWTGTNGHNSATDVRWMWNVSSNAGLEATSSKKALFTKYGVFYGKQDGYTLPLNEATYYTLSFVYGGWSDCKKDGYVTMQDPSDVSLTLIPSNRLPLDAVDGNTNANSWKNYQSFFKTNDAGNYVLGLRKDNENQQSQYVYSDFVLKQTTLAEATNYYNSVKTAVEGDYDASANGGSEKEDFYNALNADISGYTVAQIMEAAGNFYTLRDAFVAATLKYDLYVAEKANAERIDASITAGISVPTTAAGADAAYKTILVNEYNYVKDNFNADAAVKYGMTIDKWTCTATSGDNSDTPQTNSNEKWGSSATTYYEQGTNGWGSGKWTLNYTVTKTLAAGKYVLKIAARASSGTTATLKATIDSQTITEALPNVGGSGKGITNTGVASFDDGEFANSGAGYGWQWRYLAFTLDDEGEVTLQIDASANSREQWCSFGDVAIVSNVDISALETAYNNFTMQTLGFDEDEYAPYNNIAILEAYAQAKAIVEGTVEPEDQAGVDELTDALTTPAWVKNDADVDAVYNGNFAEELKGWTRTNVWGQLRNDAESSVSSTAYYNQAGSLQYGNNGCYTMPLKANTIYRLVFKYAAWDQNVTPTASVLCEENGMAAMSFAATSTNYKTAGAFKTVDILFVTAGAGNYVLTIANDKNIVLTDVSITKAASQVLEFADGQSAPNYAPGTYPTVKVIRTLTVNRWATAVYPFEVEFPTMLSSAATIATLNSFEDGELKFASGSNTANQPFLMRVTNAGAVSLINSTGITLTNVDVAAAKATPATAGTASFIGTYSPISVTGESTEVVNYVLSNNNLYKVGENAATINPYRAYIQVPASASEETKVRFVVDNEVATSIEGIEATENVENGKIYDISGRLVTRPVKGLYIKNGKKFIVK